MPLPSEREALAAMSTFVYGEKVDYDGTSNYFETDQALGDTPTLYMDLETLTGAPVYAAEITNVRYYLDMTAAETYTLYLLEAASADDVQNKSDIVFQSPAAQADSTIYEWREGATGSWPSLTTVDASVPFKVRLAEKGKLYYLLDWTGAPGDTKGYIKVRGRLLF